MQANVLKLRRVHPFGYGSDGQRDADFGSAKHRSNLVVHGLDPWEPFGKQFDLRFVPPAVKNKARARCTVPVWTQTSSSPSRSFPQMTRARRLPTISVELNSPSSCPRRVADVSLVLIGETRGRRYGLMLAALAVAKAPDRSVTARNRTVSNGHLLGSSLRCEGETEDQSDIGEFHRVPPIFQSI
jgi:hypothetical protein